MVNFSDPRRNNLLAKLTDADYQRWFSQLEEIEMPAGQILYEAGGTLSHAYFPTTSIVSLLSLLENGASAEIAVVGNDGFVDLSLLTGGGPIVSRATVQSAGYGYRLKAAVLKEEFENVESVRRLLLHYTQTMIAQITQQAICYRHHTLEKQLCRWLLQYVDRLEGNEVVITQALIAGLLGVRREGVTEAAVKLQTAGMIRYSRGHITILDREGIAQRACECYAVVKKEYDQLLQGRDSRL